MLGAGGFSEEPETESSRGVTLVCGDETVVLDGGGAMGYTLLTIAALGGAAIGETTLAGIGIKTFPPTSCLPPSG